MQNPLSLLVELATAVQNGGKLYRCLNPQIREDGEWVDITEDFKKKPECDFFQFEYRIEKPTFKLLDASTAIWGRPVRNKQTDVVYIITGQGPDYVIIGGIHVPYQALYDHYEFEDLVGIHRVCAIVEHNHDLFSGPSNTHVIS